MRLDDGEGGLVDLDAPFGDVVGSLDDVPIWDLRHDQTFALQESLQQEIEGTGNARPVELAGLRARQRNELRERSDFQGGRHGDGHHGVGHLGDRLEIGRLVRQIVMQIGVGGKRRGRSIQQHVVIVGANKCADGNDRVAAGTVLDDDRLAPARAEPIGEHARADIHAGAGAERQK
jgi:hypothetical protein